MNILLIEDDLNLRHSVSEFLKNEGFKIETAANCNEARQKSISDYQLILLDWGLPDGQGIDLLKEWGKLGFTTKVIFLTAKADVIDRVLGLEMGAHDYLTKPFDPRELVARIRVQLRDTQNIKHPQTIKLNDIQISIEKREASYKGQSLTLTKMEFDLLAFLLNNPDKPFTREELLNSVWGYDQYPTTRTVDNHILQLRQKTKNEYFETVYGIGYRFRVNK